MGKVNKNKNVETEKVTEDKKKKLKKTKSLNVLKTTFKKSETSLIRPKSQQHSCKKKDITNIIKNEHRFISNLFEILDLSKLNQGKRTESDEDENSDSMELADIPEQKVFKKQTQKKGLSQASIKNKAFPQTIEGLEKELSELKGTPMTYQKKLRKKGLQSRLVKKKRKEVIKLRKAASKSAKKHDLTVNGLSKTKPILNSDGNIVSNKFDFADTETKKENKKKPGAVNNEMKVGHLPNGQFNKNESSRENINSKSKSDSSKNSSITNSPIKKENNILENIKTESNNDGKSTNKPVFNKENKMVFSKVYFPEGHRKQNKKESKNKNPKKILEKLKEENKKISELEKEDKEKAVTLKEKQKWATALKRASGEKVKDDPELLRKSIAREKNKKMRSQKKWKARIDHVEKEKGDKQKKRKENLQSRKNEKKKKKMKKAIKKGSYVPL